MPNSVAVCISVNPSWPTVSFQKLVRQDIDYGHAAIVSLLRSDRRHRIGENECLFGTKLERMLPRVYNTVEAINAR